MPERKCVKSCRSLQHCNVMRFKQVENQSRNHALRKRKCCQCMLIAENGNSPRFSKGVIYGPVLHMHAILVFCAVM